MARNSNALVLPDGLNWQDLRDEYLAENLKPDRKTPYTLKEMAVKYNVPYASMRQQSHRKKWNETLAEMSANVKDTVVETLKAKAIFDEMEVRNRQMTYARLAQSKAMLALQALDPNKLKVSEIINLLRMGLQEERRALGLDGAAFELNVNVGEGEKLDADRNDFNEFMRAFTGVGETFDHDPQG